VRMTRYVSGSSATIGNAVTVSVNGTGGQYEVLIIFADC
jgi:hypothetical protein